MSICKSLGIPYHLWRNGRPQIDYFSDNELLFRRFYVPGTVKDFVNNAQYSISIFDIKDDSYNRESLCKSAEDVLYDSNGTHYANYGILALRVGTIHGFSFVYKSDKGMHNTQLITNHRPEECNYAHCELWFFNDGERIVENKPKSAKKIWRRKLLSFMTVIKTAA